MRQNVWIQEKAVLYAKKLIEHKRLSEFLSEMLVKNSVGWLYGKLEELNKTKVKEVEKTDSG